MPHIIATGAKERGIGIRRLMLTRPEYHVATEVWDFENRRSNNTLDM